MNKRVLLESIIVAIVFNVGIYFYEKIHFHIQVMKIVETENTEHDGLVHESIFDVFDTPPYLVWTDDQYIDSTTILYFLIVSLAYYAVRSYFIRLKAAQ